MRQCPICKLPSMLVDEDTGIGQCQNEKCGRKLEDWPWRCPRTACRSENTKHSELHELIGAKEPEPEIEEPVLELVLAVEPTLSRDDRGVISWLEWATFFRMTGIRGQQERALWQYLVNVIQAEQVLAESERRMDEEVKRRNG